MQNSDQVLSQADIDALLAGGSRNPVAPAEADRVAPTPTAPPEEPKRQEGSDLGAGSLGADVAHISERMDRIEDSMGRIGAQTREVRGIQDTVRQMQQSLQELAVQLQMVNASLQGTVGFAARENFVCNSCAKQGLVAAKLTCTSCGVENWWGWFPPQE